jgi:hypothetical protein
MTPSQPPDPAKCLLALAFVTEPAAIALGGGFALLNLLAPGSWIAADPIFSGLFRHPCAPAVSAR